MKAAGIVTGRTDVSFGKAITHSRKCFQFVLKKAIGAFPVELYAFTLIVALNLRHAKYYGCTCVYLLVQFSNY